MSRLSWLAVVLAGVVVVMIAPIPQGQAGGTGVTVTREELVPGSVTGAAPYLKLAGTFRGAVDPNDRRNGMIADIGLAPRENGLVEYESTFYILRPADAAASNGKVFYEFGNRGNKRVLQWMNDGRESNDPSTPADFGHGFLMRQGYTVVWSGWAGDVEPNADVLSIRLPTAQNPDGSPITGQVATELIPSRDNQTAIELPYPAAVMDATNGTLTMREHSGDTPEPVAGWSYEGPRRVRIAGPARVGFIYEFSYEATDPPVMGLGHAATRDFVSLLKYGGPNGAGSELLPGGAQQVYSWGRSQGGRVQRDFLYYGFNEDLRGRGVFDGMMPYATGVGRMFLNVRWAQPTVSNQQHSRRYAPEHEFPHRYAVDTDPVTVATDGLLARCMVTN